MFLTSLQSKSELFFVSIAIIGFSLIVWGKLSCLDGLERTNSLALRLYDLFLKSVVKRLSSVVLWSLQFVLIYILIISIKFAQIGRTQCIKVLYLIIFCVCFNLDLFEEVVRKKSSIRFLSTIPVQVVVYVPHQATNCGYFWQNRQSWRQENHIFWVQQIQFLS